MGTTFVSSALGAALLVFAGCGDSRATDPASASSRSQETAATCVSRTELTAAGLLESRPVAINELGQIAGYGLWESGGDRLRHGFFWDGNTVFELAQPANALESIVTDMNDNDWIVGFSTRPGENALIRALLWRDGTVMELGSLGGEGHWSFATKVNERGQIIGDSQLADGSQHAFLWEDGVMKDLGTLGGTQSTANAINDRGQIIGTSLQADFSTHGVLWEGGTATDLGTFTPTAINARGDILGMDRTKTFVRRSDGTMIEVVPFAGATSTLATGINDNAQVVGQTTRADGSQVSFLWQEGAPTQTIGASGPNGLLVVAINDSAQVIGSTLTVGPPVNSRAISWKDGQLTLLGREDELTEAFLINGSGRIAGAGSGLPALVWQVSSCGGGGGGGGGEDAGGGTDDGGSSSSGGTGDDGGGNGKSW